MLTDEKFRCINDALDSGLTFQEPFLFETLQLRLSRFRFYDREFWEGLQEHGHPFFEWVILLSGSVDYSVDQQKLGELVAGGGLLFAPGVQHLRPRLREDSRIAILQFSLVPIAVGGSGIIQQMQQLLAEKNYQLAGSWGEALEEICRCVELQPPLWRVRLRNCTERLLLSLLEEEFAACFASAASAAKADSAEKWIERIEKMVENTLDVRLSSAEYSRQLGLSSRQINRIVMAKHRMTFFRYLQRRRINAAQGLLRTPFQSVKMVANAVGFTDVSLFCRQFRQETGTTPLEYAKRHGSGS